MAGETTLDELLLPLMDGYSVETPWCAVCGAHGPLNRHHIVRRGAGELYRAGVKVPKPTITLCGMGNASGCHGLAHANRLHFRWVETRQRYSRHHFDALTVAGGHWEYLLTDEPVKYQRALEMDGWRPLRVHVEEGC